MNPSDTTSQGYTGYDHNECMCDPHVVEVGGYGRAEYGPGVATVGGYSRAI